MFRRIRKLAAQPAFRADPARVLARAGMLGGHLLTRRAPVFNLTAGGERLTVPADGRYTSITAYLLRDWVEPELRELNQLLKPGDVFVDVGANIGLFTLKGARLVGPAGRVLALEPSAEAFGLLEENLALNPYPWASAHAVAASETDGRAVLNHVSLGNDPQAFSLVNAENSQGGEPVETVRLDTFVRREGLDRLDLIKIDVEGAEPMVIAGAEEVLHRLRPTVVFECNAYLNAGGAAGSADRAWGLLDAAGYRFFRLRGRKFEGVETPPADFCNLTAVHAAMRPPFG